MIMHAIRIHAYSGPEDMRLEDLPMPVPELGQILVRVEAASVNFLDIQQRRGDLVTQAFYKREGAGFVDSLPITLGQQGIGVVELLGPGVDTVKVGDRVNFYGHSYATHAL